MPRGIRLKAVQRRLIVDFSRVLVRDAGDDVGAGIAGSLLTTHRRPDQGRVSQVRQHVTELIFPAARSVMPTSQFE